jgi:hypothetical protein
VTALAAKRAVRTFKFKSIELVGKVEQVYQGGRACFDTSTGLVAKAFTSTTLVPIGQYVEDQLTVSGQKVLVELDQEVTARWYANSASTDQIVAATVGSDCYLVDDQTVAKTSATSTRSVAGRVWAIDSVKGVLVQVHG